MKRSVIWLSALAVFLTLWSGPGVRAAEPMRLAAGGAGDFFWVMGKELCRIWSEDGLPANVVETAGDRENMDLVVSGKADAALVSGFALAGYLAEHPGAPIVTVASCWNSPVHVLLYKEFIKTGSLADLAGRRLFLGPEASPDGIAARRILAALGIKPNRYVREISETELLSVMTDFIKRELDGAVIIGPAPDPMVRDIISGTGGNVGLVPASPDDIAALSAAGLPVFAVTLPKESYLYQPEDIDVIAEGTYLIARTDLPGETAVKLSAAIFNNAGRLAAYFPRGGKLSAEDAAAHPVAPMHPALK